MFNTLEEIKNNPFVGNLDILASMYGLACIYVDYNNARNPKYNGWYFLCGWSQNRLIQKDNPIEEMYIEQETRREFRLDMHLFKITDNSPFAVHQDVAAYCLHASTMKGILNKFGMHRQFRYVSSSFIDLVEKGYLDSIDDTLSLMERQRCKLALEDFILNTSAEEIELDGKTGDDYSVHMRAEKLSKNSPNMIPLEDLVYRTMGVETLPVDYTIAEKFKQALDNHGHILYFQAKPAMVRLSGPRDKTIGTVLFAYDAKYHKEVDMMYLRIYFPAAFQYSADYIRTMSQDGTLCSFGVNYRSIGEVVNAARDAGIPIALDTNRLYFSYNTAVPKENKAGYTLVIPADEMYMTRMHNVLLQLATAASNNRILTDVDFRKYLC